MTSLHYLPIYIAGALIAVGMHRVRRARRNTVALARLQESERAGLNEPPSLHPVVNPGLCIGSGGCTRACPENALAIVHGKAALVNGSACIGHGACAAACPTQAISLVFGTAKRGVDIPQVSEEFETNVAGIFIAGELGGMGLIRKATVQGRQAMNAISKKVSRKADALDVVIVGAGPAGISAGLTALKSGLRYAIIEQEETLGGAVYHYPRNKVAMTGAFELDGVGTIKLGSEVAKEKLLEMWNEVVAKTGLDIRFNEQMLGIDRTDAQLFEVLTSQGRYRAQAVLLTLGRRGTPRRLGVPGEDLPKVVYRLVDAEQYRGQQVLIVGGGDSAVEAAVSLTRETGTRVTLSYRGEAFARVKEKNRRALQTQQAGGQLEVLLKSEVVRIASGQVQLKLETGERVIGNDAVIVCAGGLLPTPLLKSIGIRFDTKHGTS